MSIQTDNIENSSATVDKDTTDTTPTISLTTSVLQQQKSNFGSLKAYESIEEPKSKAQDWPNAIGVGVSE